MTETIRLWKNKAISSTLTTYRLNDGKKHASVLVIPGGGYHGVCEPSEGGPIARKFNELGFHAFVLNYRVFPDFFPAPQQDAMRAMRIIRGHADAWKLYPDRIAACGFSAGGHLAASIGTKMIRDVNASNGDAYDKFSCRPDFLILCYSVLTFRGGRNGCTAHGLLGDNIPPEMLEKCSPDLCVDKNTPPAFLWHTLSDQVVDYHSTLLFSEALSRKKIPCEVHLFPRGDHGMLLGLDTPDISVWPMLAKRFIQTHTRSAARLAERYTNPYQCKAEKAVPGYGKK